MYNMQEVNAVMRFVQELKNFESKGKRIADDDIGITSPYKLQCEKISDRCKYLNCSGITIGSAEQFQGHEKAIMIVSTVRSGKELGEFLSDPQRFNVVITRAKCLLIVIGNAETLRQDTNWRTFIEYCVKEGGFIK